MAYTHNEKTTGDYISANDWNKFGQELERLEQEKITDSIDALNGDLRINGHLTLSHGEHSPVIQSDAGDLELCTTDQNPGDVRARIPMGKCFSVNDLDGHLFSVTGIGRGYFKEKLGVGTGDPQGMLDVRGDIVTGGECLEINKQNTGNRFASLNLYADDTYTDYSLRIHRHNSGAHADSSIEHRGSGKLAFRAMDNGSLSFATESTERMTISSEGDVNIFNNMQIDGNLLGAARDNNSGLKIYAGMTPAGSTAWKVYSANGLYLEVDLSHCGFTKKPYVITSLHGGSHWRVLGGSNVYSLTTKSFRNYISHENAANVTPAYANSKSWRIAWIAIGK